MTFTPAPPELGAVARVRARNSTKNLVDLFGSCCKKSSASFITAAIARPALSAMQARTAFLCIVAIVICTWGEVESFFNTDTREPILRLSPAVVNESHSQEYGEDFFSFALAFHQLEVVSGSDAPLEAASKTRCVLRKITRLYTNS